MVSRFLCARIPAVKARLCVTPSYWIAYPLQRSIHAAPDNLQVVLQEHATVRKPCTGVYSGKYQRKNHAIP